MMKLACLSFTKAGERIGVKIKYNLKYEVKLFNKEELKGELHKKIEEIFNSYDGIIFVSSTGLAVRLISPYLKSKLNDPAVVVIDDMGRFTISLLSGHIGGANELTSEISGILGSISVITTASDGRGIEAVDMFAKKNNLFIENMEAAKKITSMMVEGKRIALLSELDLNIKYENIVNSEPDGYIAVTYKTDFKCNLPFCILRPRILNIGIGCRRGKSSYEILDFITSVFKENNLSIKSIKAIGSIDIKADELGIIEAAKKLNCKFKTFTKEEIALVQDKFVGSSFVESQIGVKSVAEPSAYLLGGEIVLKRIAKDGITLSISKLK